MHYTTDLEEALRNTDPYTDYVFIAVGTPQSADGSADLSVVRTVAKSIWVVSPLPFGGGAFKVGTEDIRHKNLNFESIKKLAGDKPVYFIDCRNFYDIGDIIKIRNVVSSIRWLAVH